MLEIGIFGRFRKHEKIVPVSTQTSVYREQVLRLAKAAENNLLRDAQGNIIPDPVPDPKQLGPSQDPLLVRTEKEIGELLRVSRPKPHLRIVSPLIKR